MKPVDRDTLRAAMARAQALLCDWDGCLAIEDRLVPGAAAILQSGPPFAIVSNNSTLPRASFQALLSAQGVSLDERHIHLAGDAMLRAAARQFAGAPAMVVAVPAMRAEAQRLGLRLDNHASEIVLLLRDTAFDFATLERVANAVVRGATLWVSNADMTHPTRSGLTPETGALAAAVGAMTGGAPARIFGKPARTLFEAALAELQVPAAAALMIGDNAATDGAGAERMGMRHCLVGPRSWEGSPSEAHDRVRAIPRDVLAP